MSDVVLLLEDKKDQQPQTVAFDFPAKSFHCESIAKLKNMDEVVSQNAEAKKRLVGEIFFIICLKSIANGFIFRCKYLKDVEEALWKTPRILLSAN